MTERSWGEENAGIISATVMFIFVVILPISGYFLIRKQGLKIQREKDMHMKIQKEIQSGNMENAVAIIEQNGLKQQYNIKKKVKKNDQVEISVDDTDYKGNGDQSNNNQNNKQNNDDVLQFGAVIEIVRVIVELNYDTNHHWGNNDNGGNDNNNGGNDNGGGGDDNGGGGGGGD